MSEMIALFSAPAVKSVFFYPNIHPVKVDRALFRERKRERKNGKWSALERDGVYVDEENLIEFEKQWDAELRIKKFSKHMKEFDNSRAQSRSFSSGEKEYIIECDMNGTPPSGLVDAGKRNAISSSKARTPEARIFEIPGLLAKHHTKALGDNCAKHNFINEEFATRLGLPINRDAVCNVTVGSGKPVTTTGAVTAPFRFKGEHDVHHLKFHLLPDCIHDVILGRRFLKLTETLSKLSNFYRRVKERVVKGISQSHLLYLGASGPTFKGSINGQPQAALADSGAKVLVMDKAYAQSTGVSIQTGHKHRTRLKFADNSSADTSGMAYGVEWRFGSHGEFSSPFRLNFHILENAPADVILCDTFLYDNEAFSRYHHYLVDNDDDYEDEDDESHCFAIDRDMRMHTPATASSLAYLQHLELVRRGEEADRISDLTGDEQTAAQDTENKRRAEWDWWFVEWGRWHRWFAASQANSQAQNLQQPPATPISQLQPIQSARSSTTSPQVSGSSPTSQRPLWKWPTWLKRG